MRYFIADTPVSIDEYAAHDALTRRALRAARALNVDEDAAVAYADSLATYDELELAVGADAAQIILNAIQN